MSVGRRAVDGLANSRASTTTAPDIRAIALEAIRLLGCLRGRPKPGPFQEVGCYREGVICTSCEGAPAEAKATLARYASGGEWEPICDDCARWWGSHRLGPLEMVSDPQLLSNAELHEWQARYEKTRASAAA